jgi:hypothetical protein
MEPRRLVEVLDRAEALVGDRDVRIAVERILRSLRLDVPAARAT